MDKFVWRLDNLCIEVIAINIKKYSRTSKKNWMLRYCPRVGERLLEACIFHSSNDLDERMFEFILENFSLSKLDLSASSCDSKVRTYDFLSGKCFDELIIDFDLEEQLKFNNGFDNIKVNTLRLNESCNDPNSVQLFYKLYTQKELDIDITFGVCKNRINQEILWLKLLRNTSKNIEIINIPIKISWSPRFIGKFIKFFNTRKYLKKFYVYFHENVPKLMRVFPSKFFPPKEANKLYKTLSAVKNCNNFNETLKSFHFIEYLVIEFFQIETIAKTKEIFSFLKELNLNNVKEIEVIFPKTKIQSQEINNLLECCPNLESLVMKSVYDSKFEYLSSIFPPSKRLKCLKLKTIYFSDEDKFDRFQSFLTNSNLREIEFNDVRFSKSFSMEVMKCLENLHNTLTSLTLIDGRYSNEALNCLPKVLEKCKKLQCIHIHVLQMKIDDITRTFTSLEPSSESLRKISISSAEKLDECNELFSLLEKCKILVKINLRMRVNTNHVPQLMHLIKRYRHCLKDVDLRMFAELSNFNLISEYLSGFTELEVLGTNSLWISNEEFSEFLNESIKSSRYSFKGLKDRFSNY